MLLAKEPGPAGKAVSCWSPSTATGQCHRCSDRRTMGEVILSFRDDSDLRVAILTGDGETFFCASGPLRPNWKF